MELLGLVERGYWKFTSMFVWHTLPLRSAMPGDEFTRLSGRKPDEEVVVLAKVRPFFGSRVSHFLKVEPKIGVSEDKGTNRGHPNAQITLPIPEFQLLPTPPKQLLRCVGKKTRKKWRCK